MVRRNTLLSYRAIVFTFIVSGFCKSENENVMPIYLKVPSMNEYTHYNILRYHFRLFVRIHYLLRLRVFLLRKQNKCTRVLSQNEIWVRVRVRMK